MDWCGNPLPMGRVICPKPRRAEPSNLNDSMISWRFHMRNDVDAFDSKPGPDLLDLILRKEDLEAERSAAISSSPPFFFGSPPCRASNPIARDAHFGVENPTTVYLSPSDSDLPLSAHARPNLGKKQAIVRVEGFDCQGSQVFPMV